MPIGVDSNKGKPVYLLFLLYLAIREKKSALKSHFNNFDFGSGGASMPHAELPLFLLLNLRIV